MANPYVSTPIVAGTRLSFTYTNKAEFAEPRQAIVLAVVFQDFPQTVSDSGWFLRTWDLDVLDYRTFPLARLTEVRHGLLGPR